MVWIYKKFFRGCHGLPALFPSMQWDTPMPLMDPWPNPALPSNTGKKTVMAQLLISLTSWSNPDQYQTMGNSLPLPLLQLPNSTWADREQDIHLRDGYPSFSAICTSPSSMSSSKIIFKGGNVPVLHHQELLGEAQGFESTGNMEIWWVLSGKQGRESLTHREQRRAPLGAGWNNSKFKEGRFYSREIDGKY